MKVEKFFSTNDDISCQILISGEAYELLNKLILDLKSHLPEAERVYDPKDNAVLIYNLFRGQYTFTFVQYAEVFNALCSFGRSNQTLIKL